MSRAQKISPAYDVLGIRMSDRPLSRRQMREIERQEADFHAEVRAAMDTGLSFDDAWCVAGGQVFSDAELSLMALAARSVRS